MSVKNTDIFFHLAVILNFFFYFFWMGICARMVSRKRMTFLEERMREAGNDQRPREECSSTVTRKSEHDVMY